MILFLTYQFIRLTSNKLNLVADFTTSANRRCCTYDILYYSILWSLAVRSGDSRSSPKHFNRFINIEKVVRPPNEVLGGTLGDTLISYCLYLIAMLQRYWNKIHIYSDTHSHYTHQFHLLTSFSVGVNFFSIEDGSSNRYCRVKLHVSFEPGRDRESGTTR